MKDPRSSLKGYDDYALKYMIENRPIAFEFLKVENQGKINDAYNAVMQFKKTGSVPKTRDHNFTMEAIDRYVRDRIEPDHNEMAESLFTPEQREEFKQALEKYDIDLEQTVKGNEALKEKERQQADRERDRELDVRWNQKQKLHKFVDQYRFKNREHVRTFFQKMVSKIKGLANGEAIRVPIDERMKSYNAALSADSKVLRTSKNSKYEFTDEQNPDYPGCFRIRAKRDIPRYGIKKGDLGGFVSKYGSTDPLPSKGNCWVGGDAVLSSGSKIAGNALVDDNAIVTNFSYVCGDAKVIDNANVCESILTDSSIVAGYSTVYKASVSNNATICGNAQVNDSLIHDNAAVCDDAQVSAGSYIGENAIVRERAFVGSSMAIGESVIEGRSRVSELSKVMGNSLIHGDADIACCNTLSSDINASLDGKDVRNAEIDASNANTIDDNVRGYNQLDKTTLKELGGFFAVDSKGTYTDKNMTEFVKNARESLIENTPKEMSLVDQLKQRGVKFPKPSDPDVERENDVSAPNDDSLSIDRPRNIDFAPSM